MVSRQEQFILGFRTGIGRPQELFDSCIGVALCNKYKITAGFIGPINDIDITRAIFELTANDNINLYGHRINGQKLKEIFITSIYLQYLDGDNPDKFIVLSLPREETSYDVAVYIAEEKAYENISGNKLRLKNNEGAIHYLIQIKEDFNFAERNSLELRKIDVNSLEEKTRKYEELVLVYIRKYMLLKSNDVKRYLDSNKNVGLIMSPSLEPKDIKLAEGLHKGKRIVLEKGKYNFFLATAQGLAHIKFNLPKLLIKDLSQQKYLFQQK